MILFWDLKGPLVALSASYLSVSRGKHRGFPYIPAPSRLLSPPYLCGGLVAEDADAICETTFVGVSCDHYTWRTHPFGEIDTSQGVGSFALLVCEELWLVESYFNDPGSHPTRRPVEIVAQVVTLVFVGKLMD